MPTSAASLAGNPVLDLEVPVANDGVESSDYSRARLASGASSPYRVGFMGSLPLCQVQGQLLRHDLVSGDDRSNSRNDIRDNNGNSKYRPRTAA